MQRIRLTGENGDVVIILTDNNTKALPGIFTVNANGKKVKFSSGNLFWEDSKLKFEKHQYDFPTEWDENHVGHFFWDKDTFIARAEQYEPENPGGNDLFFAANCGAIRGYTVLTRNEWDYLFQHALAENSSDKYTFNIAGKDCIVLKPDDFSGTVKNSYTAEQWAAAESQYGLVALPCAGYRYGSSIINGGSGGRYWSGTPYASDSSYACRVYFYSSNAYTDWNYRNYGYSVRLVQVQ